MIRIKNGLLNLTAFCCFFTFALTASAATKMKLIEFWNDSEPSSLINVDHSPLQEVLQKYVSPEHPSGIARFNYAAMSQADSLKLQQYLDYLQLLEPRQLSEPEAKAYWVNLYNAATLNMVTQAYANGNVTKVQARGLPARRWRRDIVTIAEQELSLNDMLHGVIRPLYKDRRVHYALFFCTLGGPDMPTSVLNGENNEELLNELEAKYLSHSRAVRLEAGELVLSEMFKDYDTDFAADQTELVAYLKQHVPEPVGQAMSRVEDIRFEYDWTLNAP